MNATNPSAVTVETLTPVAYQGVPVITTDLLAAVYETEPHHILQNYSRNATRFIEGKHFYQVSGADLVALKDNPSFRGVVHRNARHLRLWTERGAARHAKMLDTDQAWEVFEKLEDAYFRPVEEARQEPAPTDDYDPLSVMNRYVRAGFDTYFRPVKAARQEPTPDPIATMGQFVREVIEPAARIFGAEHAAQIWNAPGSPLPGFTTSPARPAPRLNPGFKGLRGQDEISGEGDDTLAAIIRDMRRD